MRKLIPKPLTAKAFQQYGDVIDVQTSLNSFEINYGKTVRFHDMAQIDVEEKGGRSGFSIFEAQAASFPHALKVMEHHPLGSQLFYPLSHAEFLVVVAPKGESLQLDKLELFITNGSQGVNYHKGVWHHYLLPLKETSQFAVVDRIANDDNCVEFEITEQIVIDWKC